MADNWQTTFEKTIPLFEEPVFYISAIACTAGFFVLIIMMACCGVGRSFPMNYVVLIVLNILTTVMVGWITTAYTSSSVFMGIGVTAAITISLVFYARYTKTDFTGCGMYLFAFFVGLFFASIAITIMCNYGRGFDSDTQKYLSLGLNALFAILFSFYIVYDVQLIMGGGAYEYCLDDYCFAAVSLYLDIINLFLAILGAGGSER